MKQYLLTFLMSLAVIAMFAWLPLTQVDAQTRTSSSPTGGVQGGLDAIKDSFPDTAIDSSLSPQDLIKKVIDYALYLSAMIATLFIIYGGYLYITSNGKEDKAKQGRTVLTNALIGLTIIVFSFVIVQVVYRFLTQS